MDFEKIKNFVLEKKLYFVIAAVVIIGAFLLKKENSSESDPTFENNKISQSSNMTSNSSSSSNTNSSTNVANNASSSSSKTVTCDISGAVKHQGVYTLKNGARLQELIEAAGGTTSKAQLKAINRAVLLKDQDKIHIPYKGEKVESISTAGVGANSSATSSGTSTNQVQENGDKVNLNTADVAVLQKLTGIGEKKAEQIIAYREQNGSFKKVEDLMQVSGIGEKTFESLKDQLTI